MENAEYGLVEEAGRLVSMGTKMYSSLVFVMVMGCQFGWNIGSLNVPSYHDTKGCGGGMECVVFPKHTNNEWTMVVSAWILGGGIGSIGSCFPANWYGRKMALFGCAVVGIGGGLLQAFSNSIIVLALGRLVSGISSGGSVAVCSVYVGEIAPVVYRGKMGSLIHLSIVFSVFLSNIAAFWLDSSDTWRVMVGISIAPSVLVLLLGYFYIVESPRWYIQHGQEQYAIVALTKLYGTSEVQGIYETLFKDVAVSTNVETNGIWHPSFRRQIFFTIGISAFNQLSGISNVFFFSSDIFAQVGLQEARIGTCLIGFCNFAASVLAVHLLGTFGRRTLLYYSSLGMFTSLSLCVITMVLQFPILTIICLAFFVIAFDLGTGPILWLIIAEIFPISQRAHAQSLGTTIFWLSAFLAGTFYDTSNCLSFTRFYISKPFQYATKLEIRSIRFHHSTLLCIHLP